MGSYPELCAKRNFYSCQLAIRITKKRILLVTTCTPTNSPTPIRTLGQSLFFGFETIWTIDTCIQLVTTKSTKNFCEIWNSRIKEILRKCSGFMDNINR